MGKRKYDPEQVREELGLYLSTGGDKVWEKAATALQMPASSLKMVMEYTWPEVGAPVIETVRDQRVAKVVELLQRGPKTRNELADALDCGPSTVDKLIEAMMASSMYEIERREQRIVMPKTPVYRPRLDYIWPGGDVLSLAHLSDLHFGSIHHQSSALHHFIKVAIDDGCRHGLVCGDITHGTKRMYRGIEMDLYAYGADEQIEVVCDGLPRHEGFTWLLMGGNHDESHFKDDGINVVKRICELRDDCTYVGFAKADIPLVPGVSIRMWHPTGGAPYAKSYRGQKGAEDATKDWLNDAITEDETKLITMLQWGHVHYKDLFWHGPMTVMNPGCFESQNIYLAEKALTPEIGAVISHSRMSESGWACETRLRWLHYRVVEDDYKPIQHRDLKAEETIEPLFTLKADCGVDRS